MSDGWLTAGRVLQLALWLNGILLWVLDLTMFPESYRSPLTSSVQRERKICDTGVNAHTETEASKWVHRESTIHSYALPANINHTLVLGELPFSFNLT